MPVSQLPLYGELGSEYNTFGAVDASDPPVTQFYLNGYFEVIQTQEDNQKLAFCKRPGTIAATT